MRTYICDKCGNIIGEGITVKRERPSSGARYQHYCSEICYTTATALVLNEEHPTYVPVRGDKITVQWSDLRGGEEKIIRTEQTTLEEVQTRNPGLITREVHKKK